MASKPKFSYSQGSNYVTEEWIQPADMTKNILNDCYDRADGPAITYKRMYDDLILKEEWYEYGERHREDGPAIINRRSNEARDVERWYIRDVNFRKGGLPSTTFYDMNDSVIQEEWTDHNGDLHRDDELPAFVEYFHNGKIFREHWHQHGVATRMNGPARVSYNPSGTMDKREWIFKGEAFSEKKVKFLLENFVGNAAEIKMKYF